MFYRVLLLTVIVIFANTVTANVVQSAEHHELSCVYDYTTSLKNPSYTGGKRKKPLGGFTLKLTAEGIEPDFCDTLTRRFVTTRLYYLHCQSKDRAVRTEHEMIIDRKTMAVTTTLHFYLNDKFTTGIIHLGQCKSSKLN